MQSVKVPRDELLSVLEKNLEQHIIDYNESMKGFREECLAALEKRIKLIEEEKTLDMKFNMSKPQSNEDDYKRVISMLKMSVDEVIELSSYEYDQYVLDNWQWKDSFLRSNQLYNKSFPGG